MNNQSKNDFNLFVFFIVSRDWQVKRNYEILKEIEKLHLRLNYVFLSEEEFTQGNASVTLIHQELNYKVLPRKLKSKVPIWLSENLQGEKDFARVDFKILVNQLGILEEDRILVVSDGIGGELSGLPSEILCEILIARKLTILLIQHSFLPSSKLAWIRLLRTLTLLKTRYDLNVYNFLYDKYSQFQAIASGARVKQTFVVGNINLFSVLNQSEAICNQEQRNISELVIFTNGSFRTLDNPQSLIFERFISQLNSNLPREIGIVLKPKSGETDNLKMRFRDLSTHRTLKFESENFSVEDIKINQLVICSIHSNVMVEASLLGFKFGCFNVGGRNQSRINYYLPQSSDFCIFEKGKLDTIRLQRVLDSHRLSPTTSNEITRRLGLEVEEVRQKLRLHLSKILSTQ